MKSVTLVKLQDGHPYRTVSLGNDAQRLRVVIQINETEVDCFRIYPDAVGPFAEFSYCGGNVLTNAFGNRREIDDRIILQRLDQMGDSRTRSGAQHSERRL